MSEHRPEVLNRTVQERDVWLKDLMEDMGLDTPTQAYGAMRAVLHALRDRLTVEMAAHLSAQMPVLLAGIFFDGWKPSRTPDDISTVRDFLEDVRKRASGHEELDPNFSAQRVFALLERKLSPGLIEKVVGELPSELQEYWRDLPPVAEF